MNFAGGVTNAKGFKAWGEHVGLKRHKKDLGLLVSEVPATAAAVFTTNKAKAAPVLWNQKVLAEGNKVKAILVNSGQANSCTGTQGILNASIMAEKLAAHLGCNTNEVFLASTGIIGQQIDMPTALAGIESIALKPRADQFAASAAAEAIITTDSYTKQCATTFMVGDKEVTIGAMAKGSGMIHPNMATMLAFIATDLNIEQSLLQSALKASVNQTYNMISVDGDTSTNDMVIALANGFAENEMITDEADPNFTGFVNALTQINMHLAKKIASDANGSTKRIVVNVVNAATAEDARSIARKVVSSNLVKSSLNKCEAHWGRVIAAVGSTDVQIDPYTTTISFASDLGKMTAFENGCECPAFSATAAKAILTPTEVEVHIDLHQGTAESTAWGCDMDYDSIRRGSTMKTKKTVVIKIGGNVLNNITAFAGELKTLIEYGYQPILVHGGGNLIDAELKAQGIEPQKKDGLRITDEATMTVVEKVLSMVNYQLVESLQSLGLPLIGFSTENAVVHCTQAHAIDTTGLEFPLGLVGTVCGVDVDTLHAALTKNQIPVLAPLGKCEGFEQLFNINADNVAAAVAEYITADMLIFMTDVPGVIGPDSIGVKTLYKAHSDHLSAIGAVKGGMLPKLHSAFKAAESGVKCIQIIDGTKSGALLESVLTPGSYGTLIAC